MLVDQIAGSVVKVLYVGRVGEGVGGVLGTVKELRIVALPPLVRLSR